MQRASGAMTANDLLCWAGERSSRVGAAVEVQLTCGYLKEAWHGRGMAERHRRLQYSNRRQQLAALAEAAAT